MSLSWIQSFRVAAVLEDCAHRLDILGHTMMVQMTREDGPVPAQEKNNLVKLARECQVISQQMSIMQLELEEKQSYNSLLQILEEEQRGNEKIKREGNIVIEKRRQTILKQQQEVADKTKKINEIRTLWQQLKDKTTQRKRIVQQSTVLKSQVLQKNARKAETALTEQLQVLRKQLTKELDSHEESKYLLENQHEELQRVLQEWQQTSKQMIQEKQTQLDRVCCKRTLNLDKLMDMRRKFRQMEQVLLEDKEEQEALRQEKEKADAASKVQAWWKGCMVRKGLGSFKKPEVEKKEKKEKKQKKKGKKKK